MSYGKNNGRFNVQQIKQAASGRWTAIIPAVTSADAELFTGKNGPCPSCGGTDRFRALNDFAETGAVFCNQCHNADTTPQSGDGIATVQWLTGGTFPDALRLIAEQVGIVAADPANDTRDIIGYLCKQKNMPVESAVAYGAAVTIRGKQRVVRFPVHDADGEATSYSDVSPYAKGKLNKGMLPKGGNAGLHLPGRLPVPGERWLIVEGVKDAAALHGLGFNAAGMTGSTMNAAFAKLFTGCDVVLVPDLDRPSMKGAAKTGAALETVCLSVTVAMLPGEIKPTKGADVRDVIQSAGADAVLLAIENAGPFDAAALLGDRPTVDISIESATEQAVADEVIRALAERGFATDDIENRIYQRAGRLVAVTDGDNGPKIRGLGRAGIRERISAAMDLVAPGTNDEPDKAQRPPGWLVDAIYERPNYQHVRRLDGIVTAPTMRADGSILQTAGYDAQSRLIYRPDGEYLTVSADVKQLDAVNAAAELLDLVCDFPFANDAAKSVWLALVMTLVGRSAVDGNVPLFGFGANIRGSGKSKLCDLAGLIAYGRTMARKTLPYEDTETSKFITAVAIEGKPAVLLDNVTHSIGGASLDAALTSQTWNDRILGKSETTGDLPWRTVLAATGNNLSFKADTARRVLLCNLNSPLETPEDRDDFAHGNIEAYTLANRHRLVWAALTMLRAFVVAGCPYDGKRLGSFESWSELIGGAIVFAGLPNPLETVSVVREQDNSGAVFRGLLYGLAEVAGPDGLTSKQIQTGIDGTDSSFETLRATFGGIADKITGRRIGNELRKYLGRVADGRRIVKAPGRAGVVRWAVETVGGIETEPPADDETLLADVAVDADSAFVDAGQQFVTGAV